MSISFDNVAYGPDCLSYTDRAPGFLSSANMGLASGGDVMIDGTRVNNFIGDLGQTCYRELSQVETSWFKLVKCIDMQQLRTSGRVCGLILDENDDGSFKIAVLGNETINQTKIYEANYVFRTGCSPVAKTDDHYDYPEIPTLGNDNPAWLCILDFNVNGYYTVVTDIEEFIPSFRQSSVGSSYAKGTILWTGKYNGNYIFNSQSGTYTLTTNKNDTLVMGCPFSESYALNPPVYGIFDEGEFDLRNILSGDFLNYGLTRYSMLRSLARPAVPIFEPISNVYGLDGPFADLPAQLDPEYVKTALQFMPVNMILTRDEEAAEDYITNGTLPPDAFLYPLDWAHLPKIQTPGEDDPGDTPGEGGKSGIEGHPTVDPNPTITANMLCNNNLYWLQAGQLESFITWFWQEAGDVATLEDLWEKIQGLYNNLGSAIINIRYFPVDPQYIGGVSDSSNIVVGQIVCPMSNVKILNKAKMKQRTLGQFKIDPKYGSFCDYSPYTELQVYLPFHGWMQLDVDIFTGNTLLVKCLYDHISGTIQYKIYVVSGGNEFLVNTCIAKMAVDLPITLQSKGDRDSAIFNNVASAMGNLMGAGASLATKNPIGLIMSTAHGVASGAESAPFKTFGTQGEEGAFFVPNRCAVYMKRPTYNRPNIYPSRVGWPCNKSGTLGSDFTGFTVVYNPTINFQGNTVTEEGTTYTIKPLKEEIDEIYSYLEKGVII